MPAMWTEGAVGGNVFEGLGVISWRSPMRHLFRCFKTSPEIIRLAVMIFWFPFSLRNVEAFPTNVALKQRHICAAGFAT